MQCKQYETKRNGTETIETRLNSKIVLDLNSICFQTDFPKHMHTNSYERIKSVKSNVWCVSLFLFLCYVCLCHVKKWFSAQHFFVTSRHLPSFQALPLLLLIVELSVCCFFFVFFFLFSIARYSSKCGTFVWLLLPYHCLPPSNIKWKGVSNVIAWVIFPKFQTKCQQNINIHEKCL